MLLIMHKNTAYDLHLCVHVPLYKITSDPSEHLLLPWSLLIQLSLLWPHHCAAILTRYQCLTATVNHQRFKLTLQTPTAKIHVVLSDLIEETLISTLNKP